MPAAAATARPPSANVARTRSRVERLVPSAPHGRMRRGDLLAALTATDRPSLDAALAECAAAGLLREERHPRVPSGRVYVWLGAEGVQP